MASDVDLEGIQAISSDDALALYDVQRLRDACRTLGSRVDDLTLEDAIAFGRGLDPALIAWLELLVKRLTR